MRGKSPPGCGGVGACGGGGGGAGGGGGGGGEKLGGIPRRGGGVLGGGGGGGGGGGRGGGLRWVCRLRWWRCRRRRVGNGRRCGWCVEQTGELARGLCWSCRLRHWRRIRNRSRRRWSIKHAGESTGRLWWFGGLGRRG